MNQGLKEKVDDRQREKKVKGQRWIDRRMEGERETREKKKTEMNEEISKLKLLQEQSKRTEHYKTR